MFTEHHETKSGNMQQKAAKGGKRRPTAAKSGRRRQWAATIGNDRHNAATHDKRQHNNTTHQPIRHLKYIDTCRTMSDNIDKSCHIMNLVETYLTRSTHTESHRNLSTSTEPRQITPSPIDIYQAIKLDRTRQVNLEIQ